MKRHLDRLEGSLPPKQAVLHWLGEAHAFGSLPAYVASLIDAPDTAQPFIALPRNVADAVWQRMHGEPKAAIRTATDEAIADTIFLLRLVLGLNVHVEGIVRTESLRHAALYWWSRALDRDRPGKTKSPPEWHAGVATLVGTIRGTDDALQAAQARHLRGHDASFPELAAAWRALCVAATAFGGDGDPDVAIIAGEDVRRVVAMARADGLDAAGRHGAATEMADRVAATIAGEGADA